MLGAAPASAVADECKPLVLLTSVDMIPMTSGRVFVPVKFGDVEKRMLLDTGGGFSEISEAFTDEMEFNQRRSNIMQLDVNGTSSSMIAHVPSMSVGRLTATSADLIVGTRDRPYDRGNPELVGILGPNLLRNYDVELNFAANRMNLFSPDHCQDKVVYWPATAVAVIPVQILSDGHIIVPVTLDGRKLDALFDTGAMHTTLNLRIAENTFGLRPRTGDMRAIGHLPGDPYATIYRRDFHSLTLEGISIGNPQVDIVPDLVRNWFLSAGGDPTGTRLSGVAGPRGLPDLILGMDVLRSLRIYISYKEEKLYITPMATSDLSPDDDILSPRVAAEPAGRAEPGQR